MKWSILIPTVVIRDSEFKVLAGILAPQVAEYTGDIEVVVYWNNFERQIGKIRQDLMEDAKGEYISFIDDDDLVADDYCEQIYPLLDGVDYIGYKIRFCINGRLQKPVIHSLANKGWYENSDGFYRRCTHKNPIKKELALKGRFDTSDFTKDIAEDKPWAEEVDPYLKTEHFIDKPLLYYNQTDKSVFRRFYPEPGKFKRPKLPEYFRYHTRSTHEG